jgi:hypothetical protein
MPTLQGHKQHPDLRYATIVQAHEVQDQIVTAQPTNLTSAQ